MNSNLEKKLNELLKAVANISERLDKLDAKLEKFDRRITNLEHIVEEKIPKLQQELQAKVDNSTLKDLETRIRKIEQQQVNQLNKDIMQESYEKRLNLLIHGIEETDESAWEKRETTLQLVNDFMKRGLQIEDPATIMLTDYHRLPQQPTYKNGTKVTRPIIIKLINSSDKHLIFDSLKNLKQFNNARKLNQQKSVYITEQLPKQFQLERKALLPAFKEAKALKKQTRWRAVNGHYYLFIDNIKVPATEINSVYIGSSKKDLNS